MPAQRAIQFVWFTAVVLVAMFQPPTPVAAQVWTRDVVDADPMNSAQGLSATALSFDGRPAVVYRKRDAFENPRIVIATLGSGGWSNQTVFTPPANETAFVSDATTVGGVAYVAVASAVGSPDYGPNSLRILQETPTGWQTVYQQLAAGQGYGYGVRLGSFNGQIAAVFSGPGSGGIRFLYRDPVSQFHEDAVAVGSASGLASLHFVQFGAEVIIVPGGGLDRLEYHRSATGTWTTKTITGVALPTSPEITSTPGTLHVLDGSRLNGGQSYQPIVLTDNGGGYVQSNIGAAVQRLGGTAWLQSGGHLYLAYEGGPQDAVGQVYWDDLTSGNTVPQAIGPGLAGPDFHQLSAVEAGGQWIVALMDETLPSGINQVVVYRTAAVPEPGTFALTVLAMTASACRRFRRKGSVSTAVSACESMVPSIARPES